MRDWFISRITSKVWKELPAQSNIPGTNSLPVYHTHATATLSRSERQPAAPVSCAETKIRTYYEKCNNRK
jgi:hypothetical protein